MIRFDNQIEAVISQYQERMQQEAAQTESMAFEDVMKIKDEFLLPVGPETAMFLNTMIKAARAKIILEIGTSYGYSTVWLAEAARANEGRLITLEISSEKGAYAQQKIKEAGLADYVEFRTGDALKLIADAKETFDFVLLDLWKDLYVPCLDLLLPKLEKEAWVVADNMVYPPQEHEVIMMYRNRIKETKMFESLLLPIGSGIEVSRFKNEKT